jgi:hypothetical protein
MNENTTANKQTMSSCFHVSLIALRILSSNSILLKMKINVKEYTRTSTKKANSDTSKSNTTWKEADSSM